MTMLKSQLMAEPSSQNRVLWSPQPGSVHMFVIIYDRAYVCLHIERDRHPPQGLARSQSPSFCIQLTRILGMCTGIQHVSGWPGWGLEPESACGFQLHCLVCYTTEAGLGCYIFKGFCFLTKWIGGGEWERRYMAKKNLKYLLSGFHRGSLLTTT